MVRRLEEGEGDKRSGRYQPSAFSSRSWSS